MDYFTDGMSLLSTTTLFLEIFDMETTDDNGNIIVDITEKTAFLFPNKNLDDLKPDDIIKIFKSEKKRRQTVHFQRTLRHFWHAKNVLQNKDGTKEEVC